MYRYTLEEMFVLVATTVAILQSSLSIAPVLSLSHSSYYSSTTISDDKPRWLVSLRGGAVGSDGNKEKVSDNAEKNGSMKEEETCDAHTKSTTSTTAEIEEEEKEKLLPPLYSYRTVQVQVIHRHGDRTPITPLKNEDYWEKSLVPGDLIKKVAEGTTILRHDNKSKNNNTNTQNHAAVGRGPFGKLTKLGLLHMIEVGGSLKEELENDTIWAESVTASVTTKITIANIDGVQIQLTPKDIRVYSTDFARTIQSAQGLLVGFFPENDMTIDIDCRGTTQWMIPDPQPRQTREQELLERSLAQRPHVVEKEATMRHLAVRVTQELLPLLQDGAFDISFGVEDNEDDEIDASPTLSWIQLTEITKCLSVRSMLPESITVEDQQALSDHTAWKWFQSLRSPRLAYISMRRFTKTLAMTMKRNDQEPPLIVYSCHDSSLIGLLCALNLEQPSHWPEYGAVMKLELLEKKMQPQDQENEETGDVEYVLRFYLNGELLRSMWNDDLREEISLEEFIHYTSTVGKDEKV
ncbi:MAG: hypothetical protein ACI8RD_009940 [Bacillariaceae sp.]|jgi:hypothetical protein